MKKFFSLPCMVVFLFTSFSMQAFFKSKDESVFEETLEYLSSKAYSETVLNKNWNSGEYKEKIVKRINDKEYLSKRIKKVLSQAKEALERFYGNDTKIVIPWSGGKDSSSLLALSIIFFPEKEYYLLTVINGLCENIENPNIRLKQVLELVSDKVKNPKVKHVYIDNVGDIEDLAINTAFEDKKILGCPAICSACKMTMEFSIAFATKKLGAKKITMGYVNYQGMQDWPEQNPIQIKLLKSEFKKVGVETDSPLYNVFKYPFDPIILLAFLGFDFKTLKLEMKCSGGGLNPLRLDYELFEKFLEHKLGEVKNHRKDIMGEFIFPEDFLQDGFKIAKAKRLISKMKELKESKEFTKGSFTN